MRQQSQSLETFQSFQSSKTSISSHLNISISSRCRIWRIGIIFQVRFQFHIKFFGGLGLLWSPCRTRFRSNRTRSSFAGEQRLKNFNYMHIGTDLPRGSCGRRLRVGTAQSIEQWRLLNAIEKRSRCRAFPSRSCRYGIVRD